MDLAVNKVFDTTKRKNMAEKKGPFSAAKRVFSSFTRSRSEPESRHAAYQQGHSKLQKFKDQFLDKIFIIKKNCSKKNKL